MKERKLRSERLNISRIKREDLKKGIFILPNLLTTGSLFMGFFSIIASLTGRIDHAVWAIFLAGVFDGLDGRVARLTHTESAFGVEYDSISDAISFGVAPAVLLYQWALAPFARFGFLAAALYAICAALRLARFNVQINTVEKRVFNGLPTPGAALLLAATVLFFEDQGLTPEAHEAWGLFFLVMTYCAGLLMVSNIRYSSFKDLDVLKKKPFHTLVLLILILILIATRPEMMIFTLISLYVLSGPLYLLYCAIFRPKSAEPTEGKDLGRTH